MHKRLFYFSLALLGLCVFSSSASSKKNSRLFSYFHAKGGRSTLRLYDTGKFEQSRGNCTYQFTAKGTWSENGDTIYLNHEKIKLPFGGSQYVDRSKKVFIHTSDSMQYVWDREFGLNHWLILSSE